MSMLAERKIKQKWSLNPRGKAWSEDSSKLGQKLLEKMGWSRGKGLGAKEDGIVDHVKVSYKNDSKGMGYKDTNDQWTEHDSNFNALLQSLSGKTENENDIKISSLEEKSQKSKVRVHYKKFTRGKDLSRCSEKDLANIFGKRSLKETPAKGEEPEENKESTDDGFTHNAGSMVDYFKKKLPNFGKNNGYMVGSNGVLKKDTDSEEETAYSGFGFKSPETKKRKSSGELSNGTPKKVKCDDEDQVGLSNPAFNPLFNRVEVQKHILNTIKEEDSEEVEKKAKTEEQGKKKKRSRDVGDSVDENVEMKRKKENKENDALAIDNPNFDEDSRNSHIHENSEVKMKKKKKKENRITVDNAVFNENDYEDSNVSEDCEVKRKKKKKDKTHDYSALDNPNFNEDDCQDSYVNEGFEVKRKKKKKNKTNGGLALDNQNFNDNVCQVSYVNEDFEVKRKKNKKNTTNDSLALDNPNFNEDDCQNSYVNNDFEVKRDKNKKNKTNDSLALDNPNFNEDDCQDSYVNDDFEVKRKKNKKNKTNDSLALDNPNFNENDCQNNYVNDDFEVKRKKKKKKMNDGLALDNPNFDNSPDGQCPNGYVDQNFEIKRNEDVDNFTVDNSSFNESSETKEKRKKNKDKEKEESLSACDNTNLSVLNFDLILNVTSTPSIPKTNSTPIIENGSKQSSVKRRKSVRFSNVTEERIIPNNEDIAHRDELFDINTRVIASSVKDHLDGNIDEISKKIDCFQAEIENDINEAKDCQY
ncbi:PIN2/TERF1-interacting telomerase inhibitor 1-like, partial [Asbolus verrucosus]